MTTGACSQTSESSSRLNISLWPVLDELADLGPALPSDVDVELIVSVATREGAIAVEVPADFIAALSRTGGTLHIYVDPDIDSK